jgi:hypothetical protein
MRRQRHAECGWPGQPGVMQHLEVGSIVRDEDTAHLDREEQLGVIRESLTAYVSRGNDIVAGTFKREAHGVRDIVIEVEVRQCGYASFRRTRASTYFLLRR